MMQFTFHVLYTPCVLVFILFMRLSRLRHMYVMIPDDGHEALGLGWCLSGVCDYSFFSCILFFQYF